MGVSQIWGVLGNPRDKDILGLHMDLVVPVQEHIGRPFFCFRAS